MGRSGPPGGGRTEARIAAFQAPTTLVAAKKRDRAPPCGSDATNRSPRAALHTAPFVVSGIRPLPSPTRTETLHLIAAGLRAPSADNCHHVRFAIDDGGLAIRTTPAFRQNTERHRRLLTLLSFGAIGENLRLWLAGRDLAFEPRWFPRPDDPDLLLDIRWQALGSDSTRDPLVAMITGRHTNRRFYQGPPLSVPEREAFDRSIPPASPVALDWFDDPARRRPLLQLIRLAESSRFGDEHLHAEMFESIDFAAGWRRATNERLAPATLEVEPFLRGPFAWMRHWNVMRAANRVGMHHVFGLRAGYLPARLSPHLGVLSSHLPPDEAALAVGAAFQRIWLTAEHLGLALQPMVASAILATPDAPNGGGGAELQRRLQQGWSALLGDALPLVVFRLGRAKRPRYVSGRRPVEDYLV